MNKTVTFIDEIRSGERYTSVKFRVDGYPALFALDSSVVSFTLGGTIKSMKIFSILEFKDKIYDFLIEGLKLNVTYRLASPVDPSSEEIQDSITHFFLNYDGKKRTIYSRHDHVAFEIGHIVDEVRIYLATVDRVPRWVLSKDAFEHEIDVFVCMDDLNSRFGQFMMSSLEMYDQSSSSSHSTENGEAHSAENGGPNETPNLTSVDDKLDTIIGILRGIEKRLPGGST